MSAAPALLVDLLPSFATELKESLTQQREFDLAAQVGGLRIFYRCPCGDDFCATFYTQPRRRIPYTPEFRTLPLEAKAGLLTVDVADGKIVCVEALYRDEIRRELIKLFPEGNRL